MAVRIAIAEDQRLIRELLAQVLGREGDFEVVAQAASGREAIALVRSAAPDVLVLDVGLPDMSGVEVARALRNGQPKLAIVALSVHEEPYFVQQMIQTGADGYVVKSAALTELVQAIRAVHEGRMFLSPAITRHAVATAAGPARLSERESQVLALIANGYQSAAIAAKLSISAGTVEAHRRNIMTKLGLHSIAELTKYAVREGLTSS
ncbi:MAG TPA: response regulator transcription factor [Burkholderiales bacterium]|jgi:two-component system NarL family response regulator